MLALWASRGLLPRLYDTLAVWREWADDVRGEAIDSGHFLAEENPEDTLRALLAFLLEGRAGEAPAGLAQLNQI